MIILAGFRNRMRAMITGRVGESLNPSIGAPMSNISRRKLITTGVVAATGAAGLTAAARIAATLRPHPA